MGLWRDDIMKNMKRCDIMKMDDIKENNWILQPLYFFTFMCVSLS